MSKKKNYNKMYVSEDACEEVGVVEETVESVAEEVAEPVVEAPAEIVCPDKCKYVKGTVVNCSKLNVRKNPNPSASIVGVLPASSEISVCVAHNYNEWYEVCTATGLEGYCMKQFIKI